jgi:hypothetical protein
MTIVIGLEELSHMKNNTGTVYIMDDSKLQVSGFQFLFKLIWRKDVYFTDKMMFQL